MGSDEKPTDETPPEDEASSDPIRDDPEYPEKAPDPYDQTQDEPAPEVIAGATPQQSLSQPADGPPPVDTPDGLNTVLRSLLQARPFFGLFEYIAQRSVDAGSKEVRVAAFRVIAPRFFWVCITLDVLFLLLVVVLLLGFLGAIGLKMLSPIPWPWLN